MAELGKSDLSATLKPFYERASEAEYRLSRLEATIASTKDAENEELLKTVSELQSKLQITEAEKASEREKAQKLDAENAKLKYRILHLVKALEVADCKLEAK